MDEVIKQLMEQFGVAVLALAAAGWVLKMLMLDGMKRDIEDLKQG